MRSRPFARAVPILAVMLVAVLALSTGSPRTDTLVHSLATIQTVVLHSAGANGSDSFILSGTPIWNYGNNASLSVGPDPTTGMVARSLLRFNLSSVPSNAAVLSAALASYETAGTGGTVQVRAATASWTEGTGNRSWTVVPVLVRETAGVNRTLEPVGITITFPPNAAIDPLRDLRVYRGSTEIPSQVYGYTYSGGQVASTQVWFDVSLGARQTELFNVTYAANDTSIPAYRTSAWASSPAWIYGPTGGGASGATVADLFGDGKLEVVFGSADGYVYCVNATGGLVWRTQVSPTGRSVPFTPQVADLDGSGEPSIVVVTDDSAVVRLNRTGSVVWRYNSTATLYTTPTLADVDGDGVLDVLVGGNMKFVAAISGVNGTLLRSYPVGLAGYTAAIGNVSGQDLIFFPGDDRQVHAYTFGGTPVWSGAAAGASFLEGSIGLGDVNGDGVPEVVTGDAGNNGILFALNATNGAPLWTNATPTYREGGQTLADLSGNGRIEVLFGTRGGTIYAIDGTNGFTRWSYNAGSAVYSTPSVTDLDDSGSLESLFLVGTNVLILGPGGNLVHSWTVAANNQNLRSTYEFPMTTPAVADLTGSGVLDVIVPTGAGMAAFPTTGLYHDWRTWGYDTNHTNLAFDGNSPNRAPFLQTTVGTPTVHPARGASWNYRDGVQAWTARGGDFGAPIANASGTPGWMAWNVTALVQGWISGAVPNDGLFLTEAAEISGILHGFASGDAANPALRPSLTVTWTYPGASPGGTPRIVGTIPDVSRPENSPAWAWNISGYADGNGTPTADLRWNVTGYDPATLAIYGLNTPGDENLTLVPQAGRSGSFRVTYWLTDLMDRFASQVAWINITPVNLPPSFAPPSPLYVRANETYRFDFGPYISDPDTPRSQLTLASDDPVHAAVSGFNVSFLYPVAYLDRWAFVNLTVSDGEFPVVRGVAIKVLSDQPPYVRSPLPDEMLLEGQLRTSVFNLDSAFADAEGSALAYTASSAHTSAILHPNGSVDLQAPVGWWGIEGLTFRATEATGAFAEDTILVTVVHENGPPVLGPVPDLRVHFDATFTFNVDPYMSDPDTPVANLTLTASDPHVAVSGHLILILYPATYNGTVQTVTLTLSDGYLTDSRTIRISVGDDWPPEFTKLPDVRFYEDTVLRGAYNLSRSFWDPDGSVLFWSSGNRSVRVDIQANGSVDLSGAPNWWGTERVTFRATDAQGGLQEDSVWVTVVRVDDAPYFRPVPDVRINETSAYVSLTPYLGDPDDPVANLTLTGTNSTHATVIGQGLLLTYASDGQEWIRVTVSDGNLTNVTTVRVIVSLPPSAVVEVVPGWVLGLPLPLAVAAAALFVVYRRRKLEWAFLVTNDGLLVSSVSRLGPGDIDTDLVTGMLTTIMDFAKKSFSDEKERNLEGLELGEKRVAIVRGGRAYIAVVYRGRAPGRLLAIMRGLLEKIEREHADALGTIVDTSRLGDLPALLQKLVTRGNLPFVSFRDAGA